MSADAHGRRRSPRQPADPEAGMPASSRLCRTCVAELSVDGAAVVVTSRDGPRHLVHSSNNVAQQIDELQFVLGEGPSLDALAVVEPVLIADLADQDRVGRWPGFAPCAMDLGVRAVFALPLSAGSVQFGVLELYRHAPGPLTSRDLVTLDGLLVTAGSLVLRDVTQQLARTTDELDDESARADVHRATGMIAVQLKVGIPEALSRLRAAAFAGQTPIVELARQVLDRQKRFTDGDIR